MKKQYVNFIYIFFIVLVHACLLAMPLSNTHATPTDSTQRCSIKFTQLPLDDVIQKLKLEYNYKKNITVNEGWGSWPVTIQINSLTLNQAIKRIFDKTNHSLKIDKEGNIHVEIEGPPDWGKRLAQKSSNEVNGEIEIVPGVSMAEYKMILAQKSSVDPLDIEVVPPKESGDRSITKRELDLIKAEKHPIDPMKEEVVPSSEPGGKGVTIQQYLEIKSKMEKPKFENLEEVPPDKDGQKGITVKQYQQIKKSN